MNHTLTHADRLLTCAACAWRGVITSDNRILQTTPGDAAHDHVGQARALLAERRAMVEQLRQGLLRRAVGYDVRLLNDLVRAIESEHGV